MFVPEPNHMTQLMDYNTKLVTVFPNGYGLGAPSATTHVGTAPVNQQPVTHTNRGALLTKPRYSDWNLYFSKFKKKKKDHKRVETTEGGQKNLILPKGEEKGMYFSLYHLHSISYISHEVCVYNRACDKDNNFWSVLQESHTRDPSSTHTAVTFIHPSANANAASDGGSWLAAVLHRSVT